MRHHHLNTTPGNENKSQNQSRYDSSIRLLRSGGKFWQQVFSAILLLSMILISPMGISPVHALDKVVLIAPAHGVTITGVDAPPVGMPEFRWMPVTGAAKYRIQVSSCPTCFDTTAQTPVNVLTSNTYYTPIVGANLADGIWYWRVRADSPAPPGVYSDIRWFEKKWATPTNNPSLISPANGATFAFFDAPIFSWTPVTGAAEYLLEICSTPGGCATPKTELTLATTVQPLLKLANGTYYWKVIPLDAGSTYHEGTPSEERSFTINYNPTITLLEPANGSLPTFTPTFRWTAVRGAQKYKLQYSTNSAFPDDVNTKTITTFSTSYTPITTLDNDKNYYWRVKAISGVSETNYTPYYSFMKRWYTQPVLLTPTNNYQHVRFPIYSWTPVPGAAYYKIEIDFDNNFSEPPTIYDTATTANTFYTPKRFLGGDLTYYWRVIPYDGSGNPGKPSNAFSFQSILSSVAPHQVYPLFYYTPDAAGIATNPHDDRTVQYPIFMWHRTLIPAGAPNAGDIYSNSYLLQVSDDATFDTIDWDLTTDNNVATPYVGDDFTPMPDTDYFWRVCPLVETCDEYSNWSQTWRAQFDPSDGLGATTGESPTLIRPTNGFEFNEATPLLEWFPLDGATTYDVEISLDESFSSTVDTAQVTNPAYAPPNSLAQRSLGAVDFGVYYWHVKSSGSATWSETRHFQISASSQWIDTRTLGNTLNRLQIGSDPAGEIDPTKIDFDLTSLQASQAENGWFFGFHVPTTTSTNVTYALYLDTDHEINSGGTSDPMGYSVTTMPDYLPEFVIYIFQEAGAYSSDTNTAVSMARQQLGISPIAI